jgi:hypothetical protein
MLIVQKLAPCMDVGAGLITLPRAAAFITVRIQGAETENPICGVRDWLGKKNSD